MPFESMGNKRASRLREYLQSESKSAIVPDPSPTRERMKLDTMEGRVGCQDLFPGKQHKHYDVIKANTAGGVLFGTSNRTSKKWVGSLWYYDNSDNLLDPFKCASAISIQSGVNDICWVSEKIFVAALDTGAIASWEVNGEEEAFTPLWEAREHDGLARSVSFSKLEKRVVSAAYDGKVKIWDLEDDNIGNCVQTYKGHSDIIHCVDHHQTAPMFATCSMDGYVIVWDTRMPKPARRFSNFSQFGPVSVRWIPNSDNLAIGDSNGDVHFGDLNNPEKFTVFKPHTQSITDMEFYGADVLATGSQDGRVKISKIQDGNFETSFTGKHEDYVRSLTFRNENEVLSCGYDGQVLKHNLLGVTSMELNGHDQTEDSPED